MIYDNKIFTKLSNYDDYYICKETTEILSTKERKNSAKGTIKLLTQVPNSKNTLNNYLIVTLVDSLGKRKNKAIHRLMAETFIPNPNDKPQVNHIDGNKLNNNLENLEWVTKQENSQHAVNTRLTTHSHCEREVHQYSKDGTYIATFKSLVEAQRKLNIQYTNIRKVALGERNTAGGFIWKFQKI